MQETGPGAMLAVGLPAETVMPLLTARLSLAAANSSSLCVVAGAPEDVDGLERILDQQRIFNRRLRTKFAFHSSIMDAVLPQFVRFMRDTQLKPPVHPYISGLTGECITEAQATSAEYWGEQMRQTVLFAKGIASAREMGCHTFLEVGPGAALTRIVSADLPDNSAEEVLSSLSSSTGQSDLEAVQQAVAQLWLRGAPIDWAKYHWGDPRRRIGLPTYPFDRRRVWLDPKPPERKASHFGNGLPVATDPLPGEIADAGAASDIDHHSEEAMRIIERQISVMREQIRCWRDASIDGKAL
jgi:acyl transferase domain-containing protein